MSDAHLDGPRRDERDVADRAAPAPSPPGRAGVRAVVATLALAAVWAAAFLTDALPLFALTTLGGLLSGLAGLWVRRGALGRGAVRRGGRRRRPPAVGSSPGTTGFPTYRLTAAQTGLALAVGVLHLGAGHLLFALGSAVLPEITATAADVYDRAGAVPTWTAIVLGGLVTAPLEEVLWRGAVHPLSAALLTRRWAWLPDHLVGRLVGSTLLYTLFHVATGQLALVAAAALGGLVWGWLLERTGSVGATMVAHATWTSLMVVLPPAGT